MEGTPYIPEHRNDDHEQQEKRLPKAEIVGSLAVESNPEKDPDIRKPSPERLGHTLVGLEALRDKQETNFEQDPVLRQHQHQASANRVSASIGGLLKKADITLDSSQSGSGSPTNNSMPQQKSRKATSLLRLSAADIAMASVIIALLLAIVLVLLIKG